MRMLPDVLLHTSSRAESRLFGLMRDVELGPDWTAYHSLNCSEHAYKHWAEIDFLVVGPEAILVLEVKGGRVRCSDGIWTYTDRFDRTRTNSEGPFGQARSAMYGLQRLFSERYRIEPVISGRATFGFGVLFPDVDWELDTPEAPATITADRSMLMTSTATGRFLRHLSHYWRGKSSHSVSLSPNDLREIRAKIRPDVDVYPPLSLRLGLVLDEMQHLTEEQYERLECIEQNERAIVSGGAGTGKTFLLLQCARRRAAIGDRVLIVVHSEVLAAYLRKAVEDPTIQVRSSASLVGAVTEPVDLLLVDEGQDLMTFDELTQLSATVVGGLDTGRWCWFMDENNQAGVAGGFDREALEYLQTGLSTGRPVRLPLKRNCRNTKEIVRQVQLWTGADLGRTEVSGVGTPPRLVIVHPSDAPEAAVEPVLRRVLEEGTNPEDIGIVTNGATPPPFFGKLPSSMRRLFTPLSVATVSSELKGRIVWGPDSAFKGLERPVVLVLAYDDEPGNQPSLYVAATRANYGLWVFASPALAARLAAAQREVLASIPRGPS